MIQEYLMNHLQKNVTHLSWTVDYFTDEDNTGTVYATSGSTPDQYDTEYRYPSYQIFIRSSDWDYAKYASEKTFETLHKKTNFKVDVDHYKDREVIETDHFLVLFLMTSSDILRLGDNDGVMEYSINFDATLVKIDY